MLAIAAVGCSPAPRDGADAPPADAAELCGNGHVDPLDLQRGPYAEVCDEGALNGTHEGRCTKQCDPALPNPPGFAHRVDLGPPIAVAAALRCNSDYSLATFSHVDRQVRVWSQNDPGDGQSPRLLQVAAPVVSLASIPIFQGPAWIEQAPGDAPHLYVADYRTNDPPTIRELPYPFPDGVHPELVGHTRYEQGLLIVDQSPAGELLIAMEIPRSLTDIATFTLRVPAPPGTRGITVDTNDYYPYSDTGRFRSRQLVVFFNDPGAFVSIDVHFTHNDDPLAITGPVQLTERTRGRWPFHVLAGHLQDKWCQVSDPPVRDWPLSVLTDEGDIFIWNFDRGLAEGETFPSVFAHVPPGTQAMRGGFTASSVSVLLANGTELLFSDGDPCHMGSLALAPSSIALTEASSSMMLPPRGAGECFRAIAGGVVYW